MNHPLPLPFRNKPALVIAILVAGIAGLVAEDVKKPIPPQTLNTHPQVFCMIQGWVSDTASPVATEINLDAVEKNRNQFSNDSIKQENGWTVCREAGTEGFKRYRLIESKDNHFTVEYQENGGGTLTTSSVIGFSVEKRKIHQNGKPATIRVLRVDSYSAK